MSDKQILTVAVREQRGKKNRTLRAEGQIPAVVYGNGVEAQAVAVSARDMEKVYRTAGGNQIVGLKVGDARQKNIIIQDVQHDARTGGITHADLYVVNMKETLKADIPLHFVGESEAVNRDQGSLIKGLETVEIEALPADLPESIEVDIAALVDFEATIHVSDLTIPAGVTLLADPEELVAKVEAPRSEEEMAELDEPVGDEVPAEDEEGAGNDIPADGDTAEGAAKSDNN